MDSAGFLIMHEDFLAYSEKAQDLKYVHITTKEKNIAEHLITIASWKNENAATLRAYDCKYRESLARLKKTKILIICQKNPFRELSSKKIFSTFKNL